MFSVFVQKDCPKQKQTPSAPLPPNTSLPMTLWSVFQFSLFEILPSEVNIWHFLKPWLFKASSQNLKKKKKKSASEKKIEDQKEGQDVLKPHF